VTTARASGNVRVDLGGEWATGEELTYSLASKGFTLLAGRDERVRVGSDTLAAECERVEGEEAARSSPAAR